MRLFFIAFAVACDIPLKVAHKLYPNTGILPLGGDDFTQLAILVLMGFFFEEIAGIFSKMLTKIHRMIRANRKGSGGEPS
jgi:hypothetical protein